MSVITPLTITTDVTDALVIINTATQKAEDALPKTGGEITGSLSITTPPTDDSHVANKSYVDSKSNHIDPVIAAIIFGG